MKKTILLFLLSIFYLNVSAQLQRHILGQELGKTTKSEALSSLESKGAHLEVMGGDDVLVLKDISFGGFSWTYVFMTFYNDILLNVLFSDSPDSIYNEEAREKKYQKLSTKITKKYSSYLVKDDLDGKDFSDNITIVSIFNKHSRICLGYLDLKLDSIKREKENNEL